MTTPTNPVVSCPRRQKGFQICGVSHNPHDTDECMFRCYFCNQVTPPKTTRHSVIIEIRKKEYSVRRRAPQKRGFRPRDRDDSVQDRGGEGREIIREVDACPQCAAKQKELKPSILSDRPAETDGGLLPTKIDGTETP